MDDLRILISRLGWPSTAARWWTMQELSARLGEPLKRGKTESALYEALRTRKLEAEVVEILCIFWMAAQCYEYVPAVELAHSIPKPSVLSDSLMDSLGLPIQANEQELTPAPEDFTIPEDFDGVQGVDLPRIFLTSMRKLEAISGFPFVRQMAFEWEKNKAFYPDAPYQGDPWHFTRPMGDGFAGQLSARAALRAISAFLRALAVGKQCWSAPIWLINEKSLLALPIHPTLALLRPHRPNWFPAAQTDFSGVPETIEVTLRSLLADVENARPGDELIAFSSPVIMSMEKCVEVSVVRWLQDTDASSIEDSDLAVRLNDFWKHGPVLTTTAPELFSTTTLVLPDTLEELIGGDSGSWPLAGTLDFGRMGYLQHDLYPSRLFFPTAPGITEVEISPRDGRLDVKISGQVVADFCYWNIGWGSARPRLLGGNCGTALVSRGTHYRNSSILAHAPLRSFYLWQIRALSRSSAFGEFGEITTTGVIFV